MFGIDQEVIIIRKREYTKDGTLLPDVLERHEVKTVTTEYNKAGKIVKQETSHTPLPVDRTEYDIYINDRIYDSKATYNEFCNILRTCSKKDSITLYLSCYGGSVHAGVDIVHAIKNCKVPVHCRVTGHVYSMAPIIALACKTLEVDKLAFFMFHDYSGAAYGKGSEQKAQIDNFNEFFIKMMNYACKPFLTPTEIKNIVDGKDLYVTSTQVQHRLKKHAKRYARKK